MEGEEYECGWRARQYSPFETEFEFGRREVKENERCNLRTKRCVSLGDAVPRASVIASMQDGINTRLGPQSPVPPAQRT